MSWLVEQIIGSLGKAKLLNLVFRIFRKIWGKLYRDMLQEVQAAELVRPPLTDVEKAQYAIKGFILRHNEAKEWGWVLNVLLEIAVGEYKRKDSKL